MPAFLRYCGTLMGVSRARQWRQMMDRVDQAITDISVLLMDAHLEPEERFRAIRARTEDILEELRVRPAILKEGPRAPVVLKTVEELRAEAMRA
ncbi:hypothetical protein DMP17_09095 [Pseudonocardia sp. TMWB2A]